ncbi:M48 family metallopeptidase [Methylotenera sp.]|uniref:M48 family metallopeptidase n=1 Tax=Methylotenera sp. TaxID=2051956 RepID=UPI00271C599A|nr:M48 family metallopeptidase [Methylotenera sp.]MDO9393062.1 M48 family metallopeptidase [Methylotenera sp.]MDP1521933.1 M48 family metallopeptidase [Methylotenera sp.]MDP2072153.1 M48 family metallopeptidase [Methylotenera sp.]MDP3006836.1 M48 family metallopeptidase [Methylotenera sp.]MDP3007227.1 M48 family metallopeptidase [Methylotenera sp.]
MSSVLTFTFIFLLITTTLIRLWLGRRHISYVQTHRKQVPAAFENNITLDAHQKAADYASAKTRLVIIEAVVAALLLAALTLGGGLQLIDDIWRNLLPTQEIIRGALVICSALLVSSFIDLPFEYYKTFVIDEKFGFNKMTPAMFLSDLVKHSLVGLALGAPILFAALWLMQGAGQYWWLYLWLVWSVFNLIMLAVYPTFIAPLFNKFSPLKDENLKQRIETLLTKCGFKSQGLFVMDGSARSSHGNAYFTGFGSSKRVVFFDTLLERLNVDEIEAVLAHELGHFKHHHVIKRIVLMFLVSFLGLALLGWLINQPWFYTGLGVTQKSDYMALVLFLMVSPVFLFLLRPIMASYSRKNEFEADDYAANHASAKELVKALVKLYRDNASTLTPDPLHSAFYDSHPPASIRISKLAAYTS